MQKRGFIKLLISIVIALIILSYFGFDLRSVIESPQTQANLDYFWSILLNIWNNYIWKALVYLWENIILGIVWKILAPILNK